MPAWDEESPAARTYFAEITSVSGGLTTIDVKDFAGDLGIHSDSPPDVLDGQ
jgi:hypothetical protein